MIDQSDNLKQYDEFFNFPFFMIIWQEINLNNYYLIDFYFSS